MVCSAEGIFTHQAFDSLSVSFFFFHVGIISFRGRRWGFGGGSGWLWCLILILPASLTPLCLGLGAAHPGAVVLQPKGLCTHGKSFG